MSEKFVIIKFRRKSSSLLGMWQFDIARLPFDRKEFLSDLDDKNAWSEHYRGHDLVVFRKPPKEEIDILIKRLGYRISYANDQIKALKKMKIKS